ncbi:hypothetical protein SAMN05216191_11484 [Paenibacillus jilunlii]|uniref:Uncharacterized protein n=1 Tax=Paenibacillus jilunlii TaxID=682956 RepID=A0A1G9UA67_9BACL|nr:hypothetical protein SAMN05216191_11484 [Paenibacillus jilunlii]
MIHAGTNAVTEEGIFGVDQKWLSSFAVWEDQEG